MRVLRYQVSNFRSFRDETELSFVSTSQADKPDYRIHSEQAEAGVLPVVGVWGANASGKTNLLKAILDFREHVTKSFLLEPDAVIPWQPFALDLEGPPTRHELEFELESVRYRYGFAHTSKSYAEEWLYSLPGSRWQRVFHRGKPESPSWLWGRSFSGHRDVLASQTRPNALFLSTAAQFNHELLLPVFRAIKGGIRRASRVEFDGFPVFGSAAPILNPALRQQFEQLLDAIDIGCVGVEVSELKADLPPKLVEMLQPEVLEKMRTAGPPAAFHLKLVRNASDGRRWTLPSEQESSGTNMMLRRLNDLMGQEQGLLVMDEMDISLHPDLSRAIIAVYTSPRANAQGRQLLFSAHDRDLMGELRRDEVLIAEKDRDGASTIHSAAEYRGIRRDRQRLQDLYSAGQLGGKPVLGRLESMMWERSRSPQRDGNSSGSSRAPDASSE